MTDELAEGTVERTEALHVVAGVIAAALSTGFAYAAYRTLTVRGSTIAMMLLLIATVALGLVLRN